jgi:shikimate kinase
MIGYREKASVVLDSLFAKNINSVISGTPSGLKYSYLQVYKKHKAVKDLFSIHLSDSHENVLDRITFYDIDSNLITENLNDSQKKRYLKKISVDYNYFKDSYKRADFIIDINNINLTDIPNLIICELQKTIKIERCQYQIE